MASTTGTHPGTTEDSSTTPAAAAAAAVSTSTTTTTPTKEHQLETALSTILQSNFDTDSKTCLLTLLKVLENVLQHPDDPKVRQLRLTNKTIQSKIVDKQGVGVLHACGFRFRPPAETSLTAQTAISILILAPPQESTAVLVHARTRIRQLLVTDLQLRMEELPVARPPQRKVVQLVTPGTPPTAASGQAALFNVYQGQRHDGQSAAVGGASLGPPAGWKSQTESQLEQLQRQQRTLEQQFQPKDGQDVPRNWTATRPEESSLQFSAALAAAILPFSTSSTSTSTTSTTHSSTSTKGDSALLAERMAKQQQERQTAESRGFTTKAMRDLERLKKQKVYSHATLAIQFPDGCIVRGNFASRTLIGTVVEALRTEVLLQVQRQQVQQQQVVSTSCPSSEKEVPSPLPSFDLYQTPPRTVLAATKTLEELQLVPTAKIFVSWKTPLVLVLIPPPTTTRLTGWFLQPKWFAATAAAITATSSSPGGGGGGALPPLPQSVPVVGGSSSSSSSGGKNKTASSSSNPGTAAKPKKKTKAEKEAAWMKRMMGGGGGL